MEIDQRLLTGIIQSLPGDFAIYRVTDDGKLKTIYAAPSLADISGMTHGEYKIMTETDAVEIVLQGDRPYIEAALKPLLIEQKDAELTYRIYHKQNGFVWIHAKVRVIGNMDGQLVLLVLFLDTSSETENHAAIIDRFDGIIYIIDRSNYSILFMNKAAFKGIGASTEVDYSSYACYELFCKRSSPCPWCAVKQMKNGTAHVDSSYADYFDRWFHVDCHDISWFGRDAIVIYSVDVTEEERQRQNLELDKRTLQTIVNNVPIGVGVQVFQNGKNVLHIENDRTRELMGITTQEEDPSQSLVNQLHAEDRLAMSSFYEKLHRPNQHLVEVFRFYPNGATSPRWYRLEGRTIQQGDSVMAFSCLSDVTAEKEGEIKLRTSHIMYEAAAETAKLVVWEYDSLTRCVTMMNSGYTKMICEKLGIPMVIEKAPEKLVKYVQKSDRAKFLDMYRAIDQGAAKASCTFWFTVGNQSEPRYYSVTCTTVFDESGRPRTVYGVGLNITSQKQEEDKYTHMYRQLAEAGIDSFGTFFLNLTKNWCGNGQSRYPSILRLQEDGTAEGFFQRIAAVIVGDDIQKKFLSRITCQNALDEFRKGNTRMSAEIPIRLNGGEVRWIFAYFDMIQNPSTGDIEAITNSQDITDRKTNEAIINVITKERFDYVGILNIFLHTFEYHDMQQQIANVEMHRKVDCEEWRLYIRKLFIKQSEWIHFDTCSALDMIVGRLEQQGEYDFTYEHTQDGVTTLRQIQYNWLNRSTGEILVVQSDITAAYEQEQKRLRQTQAALQAAERANKAKTDFVSRISHDIRTPISAISNMTEFAFEDMGDKHKLTNDLEKIRTSNQFLLSLINDILDISKIDSGKIELNPEVYTYEEYIRHIRNMFEPLCAEKGIHFVIAPRSQQVGTMVADKIRINQITLNIISNAVKYTPVGGTVRYTSCSRNLSDHKVLFAFEVADDGIGMSEAFQQKMFEPFAQEYDNPNRPQGLGGTGLGLSIVKRIVDLMGGSLTVKSRLGEGTCIRCEIPFPDAAYDTAHGPAAELTETAAGPIKELRGRVLLVEDNVINTEIALRILENYGLTVEHVDNGLKAVQAFERSATGYYDCILMDIQMPIMNGYEATERIRQLKRPDARKIPIIAMTADAFAEAVERSHQAGMVEHITKPLNPAQLHKTLQRFLV